VHVEDFGITPFGMLTLVTDYDKHVSYLKLEDKILHESSDFLVLSFFYRESNFPYLFVVSETGGSGCPAFYRVFEIYVEQDSYKSEKIGNCSDIVDFEIRANGDKPVELLIKNKWRGQVWRYSDRKVEEVKNNLTDQNQNNKIISSPDEAQRNPGRFPDSTSFHPGYDCYHPRMDAGLKAKDGFQNDGTGNKAKDGLSMITIK
jgi:hypothetical protein